LHPGWFGRGILPGWQAFCESERGKSTCVCFIFISRTSGLYASNIRMGHESNPHSSGANGLFDKLPRLHLSGYPVLRDSITHAHSFDLRSCREGGKNRRPRVCRVYSWWSGDDISDGLLFFAHTGSQVKLLSSGRTACISRRARYGRSPVQGAIITSYEKRKSSC